MKLDIRPKGEVRVLVQELYTSVKSRHAFV